jgi:hypothetical protein
MTYVKAYRFRSLIVNSQILTVVLILAATAALTVPLFVVSNPYTITFPIAALSGALLSAFYHFRTPPRINWEFTVESSIRDKLIYNFWFISVATAIVLYYVNGFNRSMSINLVLLAMYLLPLGLLFNQKNRVTILTLLLSTGLLHRVFIYFSSPLAYGVDPHKRYMNARLIAEVGNLQPLVGDKYYFAPFYHLAGAIGSILLDLPVPQGTIFLVLAVTITVTTALLVYHLTAVHWNWQAGIISLVLYMTGDFIAGNLLALATTELGLLFFSILIYCVIWYSKTASKRQLLLIMSMLVTLTFTHSASVFITVIIIISYIFASLLVRGISVREVNLAVLLGLVLILDWTTGHVGDGRTFLEWIAKSFFIQLLTPIAGKETVLTAADLGFVSAAPMSSSGILHVIGTALLLFFAVYGILYYTAIEQTISDQIFLLIGGSATTLMVLLFAGAILDLSVFVPGRWFKHLYFLLAIPGGVGVVGILSLLAGRNYTPTRIFVFLLIITIPYIVFMGGSLNGSIDDPIFESAPGAERMSFTESETATIRHSTIYSMEGTSVHGDNLLGSAICRYHESDATCKGLTVDIREDAVVDRLGQGTIVIVREHMYSGHAQFKVTTGKEIIKVRGKAPISHSTVNGYSLVYQAENGDCSDISCGLYYVDK